MNLHLDVPEARLLQLELQGSIARVKHEIKQLEYAAEPASRLPFLESKLAMLQLMEGRVKQLIPTKKAGSNENADTGA